MTEPMRVFDTGASRTKGDKLSYARALSVQVLERYMQYLRLHRELPDGNKREFDNWKLGIPKENYIDSLMRHTVDTVRKFHDLSVPEDASLEDLCCAVIFNASGLLFELLVEKSGNREIEVIKTENEGQLIRLTQTVLMPKGDGNVDKMLPRC
jgi:hypothetical protein